MFPMLRRTPAGAATFLLLGLAACCDVFGTNCRPDCRPTPIPAPAGAGNAVSYQIGAPSCPASAIEEARSQAARACRDRGMSLASGQEQVKREPPVPPLDAAETVTFSCQR
jgi:hypothetical protein